MGRYREMNRGSAVAKINPFEKQPNAKKKHDVLGRKVKGDHRNVAIARANAGQRRRSTLLSQFQNRKKANSFKDRRIAEHDETMTAEDKMLKRFQAERKRKHRRSGSTFNLGSEDEAGEDEFLTHGGLKIDDYDELNGKDNVSLDGSDDGKELDQQIVSAAHFGGGNENENTERKKTHQEIMQEVIKKSKYYKAEKQKAKAHQEDETENLDKNFDEIQNLLSFRPTRQSASAAQEKPREQDQYNKLARELLFEAKSKASDRRKTKSEIALEKKQKLDESELKRRENPQSSSDNVPFVLPCPQSPKELADLFSKYGNDVDVKCVILQRIIDYYSPLLDKGNSVLMKALCASLIRRISLLALGYESHFAEIDVLAQYVLKIAHNLPNMSEDLFRKLLIKLQARLIEDSTPCEWPHEGELLLLRLMCNVLYNSQDQRPTVVLLQLYLGQCLTRCTLDSLRAVASGLFCCALMLHISRSNRHHTPEVGIFLSEVVKYIGSLSALKTDGRLKSDIFSRSKPLNASMLANSAFSIIEEYIDMYQDLPSAPELFAFLKSSVDLSGEASTQREEVIQKLQCAINSKSKYRRPLRLRPSVPSCIQTFEPKFDENYTMRKNNSGDRERAEMKQLHKKVKRERKAAARELRLDATFIARERDAEKSKFQEQRQEKQREIQTWLAEQAATFNQQVKKGGELLKGGGSGLSKRRRVN